MADTEDFAALLGEYERKHAGQAASMPRAGEHVHGTIVSMDTEQAIVDLGAKFEGVIDLAELADGEGQISAQAGDAVDAVVLSADEASGTLVLGSGGGRRPHGEAELERAYESHLPVEGRVTGLTKGGVEVQLGGVRAFCPISQLDIRYVEDPQELVGQHLSFRITRYQGGRRLNIVVSRRALLEEEQQARAEETRARLEVGAVLQGTVTALKDYGAFVDIGGVEGMVHVSELSFGRVGHPQEVLKVGQSVEVAVLRIEQAKNPRQPARVALSLRALARDPWEDVGGRFPAGSRVAGIVTRVQAFGAFVELAPGIEGMVHISELSAGRRIGHPREVLASGDAVEATVLGVDRAKRRISLSLDLSRQGKAADLSAPLTESGPEKPLGSFGELLRQTLSKRKPD